MDSMRSLNTSLPSASSGRRQNSQGPDQVPQSTFQAFRQAALSVTNLYKAAASEHVRVHNKGYSDALEDLLSFMDDQHLGLGEGEGWAVRQWATEKLKAKAPFNSATDSDEAEEEVEDDKMARSCSPVIQTKQSPETQQPTTPLPTVVTITARPEQAPLASPEYKEADLPAIPQPSSGDFTFRSSVPFPQTREINMEPSEQTSPGSTTPSPHQDLTRSNRSTGRNSRLTRNSNRTPITLGTLGSGAGLKRRAPIGEWFDIGNLGKDPFGGSGNKRGRFT